MKNVIISESQLAKIVKKYKKTKINEGDDMGSENYMFFKNLMQIKRQAEMLLEMDPMMIDQILADGHDWADDHITVSKENMDQVFDFMMNKINEPSIMESKKRKK